MKEEPFQPLIDELAKLLKVAENAAARPLSGPIDPEIEKELLRIEEEVKAFKSLCDEEIAKEGKTDKEVFAQVKKNFDSYTPHEKKLIRQLSGLGVNAVVLRAALARAKKSAGVDKKPIIGKNTKKSIQKRQNKFKGLGPSDQWKRL